MLLKRRSLHTYIIKKYCDDNLSNFNIKKIPKGIKFNISAKGKFIKSSLFLIDFIGKDFKNNIDFSLANEKFLRNFDKSSCFF